MSEFEELLADRIELFQDLPDEQLYRILESEMRSGTLGPSDEKDGPINKVVAEVDRVIEKARQAICSADAVKAALDTGSSSTVADGVAIGSAALAYIAAGHPELTLSAVVAVVLVRRGLDGFCEGVDDEKD